MLVSVPPPNKTRVASYFPQSEKRKSLQWLTKLHKVYSLVPFWLRVLLVSLLSCRYTGLLAFPRNSQMFSFCRPLHLLYPPPARPLPHLSMWLTPLPLFKCLMLSEAFPDSTISAVTTTSSSANTPYLVFVIYVFPRFLGKAYFSYYICDLYCFSSLLYNEN